MYVNVSVNACEVCKLQCVSREIELQGVSVKIEVSAVSSV